MAEVEFQCHLARFIISNNGVMRCHLASNLDWGLKGNMILLDERGDQQPGTRGATRWEGLCCSSAE